MSEKQKEALTRIDQALERLPSEKLEYLLGFADGLVYLKEKEQFQQSSESDKADADVDDDLPFV